MENNYKELFQKILPTLKFEYPEPKGLEYEVIYHEIEESPEMLNVYVESKPIREYGKIKLTKSLFTTILQSDIESIKRLINLDNKLIRVYYKKSKDVSFTD